MKGEGYVIEYLKFSPVSLENCIPKSIRNLRPIEWVSDKKIPSPIFADRKGRALNLLINKKNL